MSRLLLAGLLLFLDHARRALDPRFGVEDGLLDLLGIGVERGRDTGAEIVHAEERRECVVDLLLEIGLNVLHHAERLIEGAACRVVAGSKKLAGRIENGDVVDIETRDGRSNEMTDGRGGAPADRRARANHHRCGRRLLGLAEAAPLGHDDMDTGRRDAGDLLDGAGNLALQCTNARNLLHEGGEPERADIVEKFVTGIGAARQAAFGQEQASLAGHADRHLDAAAIRTDLEVEIRLGKRNADLGDIAAFEAHIERFKGRLVDVDGSAENEADCDDAGHRECYQLALPEIAQVFRERRELIEQIHSVSAPSIAWHPCRYSTASCEDPTFW
ncbi:hypothetical protein ABIE78_005344 [Sinorhizobium fredii]